MELENRILNLIRKSDDKSFYAVVRAYPNRYARLENETIKVSYLDSEDNMTRKDVDLNYVIAKAEECDRRPWRARMKSSRVKHCCSASHGRRRPG